MSLALNLVARMFALLAFTVLAYSPLHQALKIPNLVPRHCSTQLEQNYNQPIIKLDGHGNNSVIVVSATILYNTTIVPNYKCFVAIESPPNAGLIWTMKRATFNDNDTIALKSGANNNRIVKKTLYDADEDPQYDEVFTLVNPNSASSLSIAYEPTTGPSQVNAGFDMVVTVYREKQGETCGSDFDCQNDRCIAPHLQCDGLNNCGNSHDEDGCFSAITWMAVAILIVISVIVLVLALFVWVRMSRG